MTDFRKVTDSSGRSSVVVFTPEGPEPFVTADESHPNWERILEALENGDPNVGLMFDLGMEISTRLGEVSERVSYNGRDILFDGDPIRNELTDLILRGLQERNEDYIPYVKFMVKTAENPNEHSREQLFSWLSGREFSITREGDIVGYKGVSSELRSISKGTAFVDGVQHVGTIPNEVGTVVTMPRSEVEWDPAVGCHKGLHVGTWEYASSFAPVTLEVHVNPRDVVSVPTDCNFQKMRCCRYTVVREVTEPYSQSLV